MVRWPKSGTFRSAHTFTVIFFAPPEGEENSIPPLPEEQKTFTIKHNHVISLEDDFNYYQRRGQGWKVVSVDAEKQKIDVQPTSEMTNDGINTPYTFDIDIVTHVWKGRQLVELNTVVPGMVVQFSLGWSQGRLDEVFSVSDIWLDKESRESATERQRWVPGWIDTVEHFDFGGGIVTLTFFAIDPALIE